MPRHDRFIKKNLKEGLFLKSKEGVLLERLSEDSPQHESIYISAL